MSIEYLLFLYISRQVLTIRNSHPFRVPPSLLNKINEMEDEFEKPAKGRPMKGGKSGDSLTRGRIKKVNEFMTDLKGVMVSDNERYLT